MEIHGHCGLFFLNLDFSTGNWLKTENCLLKIGHMINATEILDNVSRVHKGRNTSYLGG